MKKQERIGLAIYLYYNRDVRRVVKFGDVIHHSKKLRYVLIYVNKDEAEAVMTLLKEQKFIKDVVPSYLDDIDQDFVGNLHRLP